MRPIPTSPNLGGWPLGGPGPLPSLHPSPFSPSPPGSCLNTLKQSKSNYHEQAAWEHLLHPSLGIANAPAPSTDRRWAPCASRVARCSRAVASPCHPAAWHREGRPSLCFQRSPHSCHLQRSVRKSSPHEVIHMEHHICRIFILTCVRVSSGCRQSLCLTYRQLEWSSHPRGHRAAEGWVGSTHKGSWPGLGDPGQAQGCSRSSLGALREGLASPMCPWLLLSCHSC